MRNAKSNDRIECVCNEWKLKLCFIHVGWDCVAGSMQICTTCSDRRVSCFGKVCLGLSLSLWCTEPEWKMRHKVDATHRATRTSSSFDFVREKKNCFSFLLSLSDDMVRWCITACACKLNRARANNCLETMWNCWTDRYSRLMLMLMMPHIYSMSSSSLPLPSPLSSSLAVSCRRVYLWERMGLALVYVCTTLCNRRNEFMRRSRNAIGILNRTQCSTTSLVVGRAHTQREYSIWRNFDNNTQ